MRNCSICRGISYRGESIHKLCGPCYRQVTKIIELSNNSDDVFDSEVPTIANYRSEGLLNALEYVKETKKENLKDIRLRFSCGLDAAYRNQIHCDIKLKPGENGPSISAHKALLAIRSDVFKNMLDSDACKTSVPSETITLHEMSYLELESLLEFLYTGDLPKEKLEKNVYALTKAAHKYEIPFLQIFCENHMIDSLNSTNALDVLEISDNYCNVNVKVAALSFIIRHTEDVLLTDSFDAFVVKNPHLSALITRILVKMWKEGKLIVESGPNKFLFPCHPVL